MSHTERNTPPRREKIGQYTPKQTLSDLSSPFYDTLAFNSGIVRKTLALIGFQGRGRDEVVQSDFYHDLFLQWFGQKSCGDSAVRSEFVIAGMIFHPSRVKS